MSFNYSDKISKIEDVLTKFLQNKFDEVPSGVKQIHFDQLYEPCQSLLSLGGKRWRPLFMVLCSELINSNSDFAYKMTPLVEMVHTASLIHDDIEDGADTRRGQPSAYITYGLDTALNAGSWLYFTAFSAIDKNCQDEKLKNVLYAMLASQLRRLHLGQAMDIYWHRNPDVIPSHEEYSAMVRMKTGTLANLSAQAGIICGGGSQSQAEELGQIASMIGEGFQVLDDIINITTGNVGKKRGDDIVEGKKSLPLIFHLEEKPQDKKIIQEYFRIAAEEGIESPVIEETISLLNTSNCIPRAKEYAHKLISDSCKKIRSLYNDNDASLQIEQLFTSMLK